MPDSSSSHPPRPTGQTTRDGRVLVVDDDPDIRASLADSLNEEGFSVTAFADGREALEWLNHHSGETRLVLLDLMMPNMDGDSFLTAKERDPVTAEVPVVLLSGSGIDVCRAVSGRHRVRRFFDKPIAMATLMAVVRGCFETPTLV